MSKNPYITQVDTLVERTDLSLTWTTIDEAKRYIANIRQLKKEIALVKHEIATAKQQIHATAVDQRAHVGKGFGGGAVAGIFGMKLAGKASAATKNDMRNRELKVLAPYQEAERYIATAVAGLDKLKLEMDAWIAG